MELGSWKDAEKLIDKSLKMDEENYRSIFQKAKVQTVLSQLDEAEKKSKAFWKNIQMTEQPCINPANFPN